MFYFPLVTLISFSNVLPESYIASITEKYLNKCYFISSCVGSETSFFKMCFMGAVFPNLPEGEQGIKSASLKLRPQRGCAGVAGIFSNYLYVHLCLSYQSIMFLNSPSSQGIVGWQTILDPLSKTVTSGWLMHRGTELSLREGPTDGNLGILFYVVLSVTGNGRNLHCWVCYSSYILREGQVSYQSCPVVSTACSGSA